MRKALRMLLMAMTLLALPCVGMAAEAAAPAVADKPIKITERSTPVALEHEGTDSIGAKMSTRIKEALNASNLFNLTEQDTPKLRLLLSTVEEFPSRPGVGSAYAAVWVFSQSETTLRHFLMREVGVITPDQIDGLAAKLVEKTDQLAVRYGYLFK